MVSSKCFQGNTALVKIYIVLWILLGAHNSPFMVPDRSQLEIFCRNSAKVLCLKKSVVISDRRNMQIFIYRILHIEVFENLQSKITTDFCRIFFTDFLQKISSWVFRNLLEDSEKVLIHKQTKFDFLSLHVSNVKYSYKLSKKQEKLYVLNV